jgi:uncharacterized membrane protein YjjB (DUF3815 family)
MSDRAEQVQFLAQLGGALSAAEDPVSATQHTLVRLASYYGLSDVEVAVLLGSRLLGGYLGGFLGAVLMTLVAYAADCLSSAPASRVLFLPAFWLLVPGVLAVVGLAELVGSDLNVALADLSATAFSVVSIALGVLVGVPLGRAFASNVLENRRQGATETNGRAAYSKRVLKG